MNERSAFGWTHRPATTALRRTPPETEVELRLEEVADSDGRLQHMVPAFADAELAADAFREERAAPRSLTDQFSLYGRDKGQSK